RAAAPRDRPPANLPASAHIVPPAIPRMRSPALPPPAPFWCRRQSRPASPRNTRWETSPPHGTPSAPTPLSRSESFPFVPERLAQILVGVVAQHGHNNSLFAALGDRTSH